MNEAQITPKSVKLQIGLRSFLIFVVLAATVTGLFSRTVTRARSQRHVVQQIHKNGGVVIYDVELDANRQRKRGLVPQVLESWLGVDFFLDVDEVRLIENTVSTEDVTRLTTLSHLQVLYSGWSERSNFSSLAKLPSLKSLFLTSQNVELTTAPEIELPNLDLLSIRNTNLRNLDSLAELTNLRCLYLKETATNDFSALSRMAKLETLVLRGTQACELSQLANLTRLRLLDLSETKVVDIAPLANLKNLMMLDLSETNVVDLSPLAELTQLSAIRIFGTDVSEAEIEKLKKALPGLIVRSDFEIAALKERGFSRQHIAKVLSLESETVARFYKKSQGISNATSAAFGSE